MKNIRNEGAGIEIVRLNGTISTLFVTDGTMTLLQGMQERMASVGLQAKFAELAGSDASFAMNTMRGSDAGNHFACFVGNQLVIGTFQDIGFEEGDGVAMMVSRFDRTVLFAHAVVRIRDALLWLPHNASKGRLPLAKAIAKMYFWASSITTVFVMLFLLANPVEGGYWTLFSYLVPALLLITGFAGGGTYYSSLDDAEYAEQLLKALGFKRPRRVDLSPFSEVKLGRGSSRHVYNLRTALENYGSIAKMRMPDATAGK